MTRSTTWLGTAGLVTLLALSAGCTSSADTSSKDDAAPPSASARVPVITTAQAKQVFEHFDRGSAAADAALDDSAVRKVQTGVLLKESLAVYRLYREANTGGSATHFTKPRYLIPAVKDPKTYPRFFAVTSKKKGEEDDRSSVIFYFVQPEAGAPWKATADTSAVTEPVKESAASEASPTPEPAESEEDFVSVEPKQLPDVHRDASGAVPLSPTAASDRSACNDFAEYLSFTVPHGRPVDDRFTSGAFTSDVVRHYNGWATDGLTRRFSTKTTGTPLPVFRLATGGSLVACQFVQEYHAEGETPSDTMQFGEGSEIDVLLGGGGESWRKVDVVYSMTALIEVPPGRPAAATVLACDCYAPQTLSATGVRPD